MNDTNEDTYPSGHDGVDYRAREVDDLKRQLAEVTAERDAAQKNFVEEAQQRTIVVRKLTSTETALAEAKREAAAAQARERALREALARSRAALDRDRTGLAGALNRVINAVRSRTWLLEGRGAYEWDDVRYKEEAGLAMREAKNIADDALRASGKLADVEVRACDAALAAPADETALREFGLKCITIASSYGSRAKRSDEALVDAVLRGEPPIRRQQDDDLQNPSRATLESSSTLTSPRARCPA